jgi:hypothetical protein
MAIDVFQRRAIWEAHGKRCAYCREPLLFKDLEVDHVIPRDAFTDPDKLQQIRLEQGLPDLFNPEGYENLSAACGACNRRKLAEMLAPGRLAIELALASKYAIQIQDRVRLLAEADQRDRVRLAINSALASGQVTPEEIEQLAANENLDARIFKLSPGAWIFENQPLGDLSAESYEANLDRPILLYNGAVGLELTNGNGEKLTVSTFRQFEEAKRNEYFAESTWSMNMAYQYFIGPLDLLRILRASRYAEKSFVRNPYLGLSDLALLPATLLWVTEDMTSDAAFRGQRDQLRGLTIKDMLGRGAQIDDVGSRLLAIHYDGGRTYLLELLRADVNGDEVEEIVLHRGCGPLGGTYRQASLVGLVRRSDTSMFEEITLN